MNIREQMCLYQDQAYIALRLLTWVGLMYVGCNETQLK